MKKEADNIQHDKSKTEPRISPQRLRTLYVMKILLRYSDENHTISSNEIVRHLREYGVSAERKSIYSDIAILNKFGLDIETVPNVGYYVNNREFELAELKLLVDAVQASKFITQQASKTLIRKLEGLTSEQNAVQLHRQVFIRNRLKSGNKSIYYNVDMIHMAISQDRQISYKYCQWTTKKRLSVKKDGALYIVSPWALTWSNENYYLVGCIETDEGIEVRHFRVDKMKGLALLEANRIGRKVFDGFDLPAFAKKTFGMYGGHDYMVTLNCSNDLIGVVIDRFGKEVPIIPVGNDRFETKVLVAVSRQFFGWATGIGSGMRIVGPGEVVREYYEYMRELMGQYETDCEGPG